jgi:hypothetical protein
VNGRIISEWILEKETGSCGLNSSDSRCGPVVGSYEHGNEPWCSIKGKEFFD